MRHLLLPSLLIALACNDQSLGKFNSEPEATITSPTDGAALLEGDAFTATGRVSDPNSTPEELLVTWSSGGVVVCAEVAAGADGSTTCDLTAGLALTDLVLQVVDPGGATALDSIALSIGATAAPTATITAPADGAHLYAGETFGLEGLVADAEDPADTLTVAWTSSLAGDLGAAPPDSSGRSSVYAALDEGDHVITLEVTDHTGKTGTDDILLHVGPTNTAPTCGISRPADGDVVDSQSPLSLAGFATDAEQAAPTLLVAWSSSVDGDLGSSTPTAAGDVSLTTGLLTAGPHSLSLTVTDERGLLCADAVEALVDAAPTVSIEAPLDGARFNEDALIDFAGLVDDADEAAAGLHLTWTDDSDGLLWSDAAAADGSTAFSATLSPGLHTTTLTATDAWGLSTSAQVEFTVNGLPSAPGVHISPDPADTDDALVVVIDIPSVDLESDPVTYTYAWARNGLSMPAYTTDTVPASATTKGDLWTVTVTPNDGSGDGAAGTDSITIDDTAPVMSSVAISPTTATTNTLLSAVVASTDADGDSVTYTYAWTVDGVAAGSLSTLAGASAFSKGDVVVVTVTPYDGTLYGSPLSSAPLTIDNTPPTTPGLSITPAAPEAGADAITCLVSASSDADGDAIGYDITWTVDGQPYPGTFSGTTGPTTTTWTDDTIPAADTDLGSLWTCTVTPYDPEEDGTAASVSVTVTPASAACSGDTVYVAYLPGWSPTHTDSSLVWTYLASHSLSYGDCTLSVTTIPSNFTLSTLTAYDVLVISDPSGGGRVYTSGEAAAIRSYLTGGNGGAVATYLLKYSTSDNSALADLFGVTPSALTNTPGTISTTATVVAPTHPLADNLGATFKLLTFTGEQGISGGWASASLASGAQFVMKGSGQSSVVAYEASTWRSVWFSGMPDYGTAGFDSQQAIYNAILWSAGYQ